MLNTISYVYFYRTSDWEIIYHMCIQRAGKRNIFKDPTFNIHAIKSIEIAKHAVFECSRLPLKNL